MKFLDGFEGRAYALLRIVAGFMFCMHGVQKMFGVPEPMPVVLSVGSQVWFGSLIELFGGFLVMIGLQTRWAAFICSGMMAVAYTQFHWKLQWGADFFPLVNRGEPAVLYCFVFLYLACKGDGKWSLGFKS